MPENLVSRDGFSRPVPRQPAHLHTQAESGMLGVEKEVLFHGFTMYVSVFFFLEMTHCLSVCNLAISLKLTLNTKYC